MKRIETETLIIGAGPAGLACAKTLSRAGKEFVVLERESIPGGLSRTYKFVEDDGAEFYTDNGPHRFLSKNQELYDLMGETLGDDWIRVDRYTRQFIDGKFYDYPINAPQALRNIGPVRASGMLVDYVRAKVLYKLLRKEMSNFEHYIEAHFGRGLGEFCMINYTEKIWGIPAGTIHQDWAQQRIKGLDLLGVLRSFARLGKKPKTLSSEFFYPRRGAGQAYENMVENMREAGHAFHFDSTVTAIKENDGGFEVEFSGPEGEFTVDCAHLVHSIPVKESLALMEPVPPQDVLDAVSRLSYRSQAYLFVTIDKDSLTKDQWIYFPGKDVPFGRVSEMKNFSTAMAPEGKTSLFVEFFCTEGDEMWNMGKDELFDLSMPYFESANLFGRDDVRNVYHFRQKNVYPVYDVGYRDHAERVKEYLDSVPNLYAIGRPGRFRYNNQDHSLEMGMRAARSIIEGIRHDIESVGSENEYYEKGKTKIGR